MNFYDQFIKWYKETGQDLEKFSATAQIPRYRCRQLLEGNPFREKEEKKLIYLFNLNPSYFFVYDQPIYQKKVHKKTKYNFSELIEKIGKELSIKKIRNRKLYETRRRLIIQYNVNPDYFYFADVDMFNNSLVKYPQIFTKEEKWEVKQWLLDIQTEHNINILDSCEIDNINSEELVHKVNNLRLQLRQTFQRNLEFRNNRSVNRKSKIFTQRLNNIPSLINESPYKINKKLNFYASTIYHWREGTMPGEAGEKYIIATYNIDPMYFYLYEVEMYTDKKRKKSQETFIEKINRIIKQLRKIGISRKSIFTNVGFSYLVNNSNIGFFEFRRRLIVAYNVNPYFFYYDNEPMFNNQLEDIGGKFPQSFAEDQAWDAKQWLLQLIEELEKKQNFKDSFNSLTDIQLVNLANDVKAQLKVEFEKVMKLNRPKKIVKKHRYIDRLHNKRFGKKIETIVKCLNKSRLTITRELESDLKLIYQWQKGALPKEKLEKKFLYKYSINPEYLYGFTSKMFTCENKRRKNKSYFECLQEIKKVLYLLGIDTRNVLKETEFKTFYKTDVAVSYEFRRRLMVLYNINPSYFFYIDEPMFKYNLCKYPSKFLKTESWDARQWLLHKAEDNRNFISKEEIDSLSREEIVEKANYLKSNC